MEFDKLTPEEQERMCEFWRLTRQPPEYFNNIINSGMCNSIITGYILLAMDRLELADSQNADVNRIAAHIFDDYSAEQARERKEGG